MEKYLILVIVIQIIFEGDSFFYTAKLQAKKMM